MKNKVITKVLKVSDETKERIDIKINYLIDNMEENPTGQIVFPDQMNVKIKKLNENAVIPTYGSPYAAGADLYAVHGCTCPTGVQHTTTSRYRSPREG